MNSKAILPVAKRDYGFVAIATAISKTSASSLYCGIVQTERLLGVLDNLPVAVCLDGIREVHSKNCFQLVGRY